MSVVTSPLSFLFLFIWVSYLFFSYFFFLDYLSFISGLVFFMSFFQLTMVFVCCSFSTPFFKCKFRPFIWDFSCSLRQAVLLWITLIGLLSLCPLDFGLLCSHFYLFQGIFHFFLHLIVHPFIVCTMLFSLHVFVCFSGFFFLVIDFQSHNIVARGDAWYDFSLLQFIEICFVSQHVVCPGKHPRCTLGWNAVKTAVKPIWPSVSFKASVS